jgi:dihydroxyacetone kinase-like protein
MAGKSAWLTELDSIVGDADLGLTMSGGFKAAYEAVEAGDEADAGKLLYLGGKAMAAAVPSTMGTLMASGFMEAGKRLKGRESLGLAEFTELFDAYVQGVANRGKAARGEKTFIDGLAPAVDSLKADAAAGKSIVEAAINAAAAAKKGFEDTGPMVAVHGRAAVHGDRSKEMPDPGAAVAMLMMQGFMEFCKE